MCLIADDMLLAGISPVFTFWRARGPARSARGKFLDHLVLR
jgi:hypothetical protein